MDVAQLQNFIQVAELGSLSSAADHLKMSQSALSRQIGALEDVLGVSLFMRHRRGMVITAQGRNILERARALVTEWDELSTSTRSSSMLLNGQVATRVIPTVEQLRNFIQVAELGSLSSAADHLKMSQSALSRQIGALEDVLGVSLFMRHRRGMVITAQGRNILERARALVTEWDELSTSTRSSSMLLNGQVAIGLPSALESVLSIPIVSAFQAQHPEVLVQLTSAYSGYLLELLHQGEIDLAVLYNPRISHSLRTKTLLHEDLFLIGPPGAALSREYPLPFCEIAQKDLLLPTRRNGLRDVVETNSRKANVQLNVVIEVDSYTALRDLVRHGYGYTILPLAPVCDELSAGQLTAAPITDPVPSCRLALSYPSYRDISRAAQFAGETLTTLIADRVSQGIWPTRISKT
ncbi:LysR substrate-binding domain-containing protein (plasmid) [Microvirga terrae]|uniref:LysR substrate-binding domain-containing protein n=1 Tax=Microvirga terrae TaxID=2740529 RepID=A0ABY5RYX8_9HYPH|nr:LysR family transcriptional regulator [Microvirga terrae]UVF22169.1 LysR substrate-binding domain-containing protein [Microvirga terrae]